MEDVIISMQSVQNYDDEEDTNTLNFMTDGKYTYDHDVGCLTYEESEVFGLPGTRTSVFIMPDRVIVDRDGATVPIISDRREAALQTQKAVQQLKLLPAIGQAHVFTAEDLPHDFYSGIKCR